MRKLKIFYLTTGLGAGGAEIMLKKILINLNKDKYSISICSLTNTTDLVEELRPLVKRIYIFDVKNVLSSLIYFFKLRKILKEENPDILHCLMPHANLFGRIVSLGLKCKVLSSIRVKLYDRKYLLFLDKISKSLVDYYIVNSKTLQKFTINNGINHNKVLVIQNGVDFDDFKKTFKSKELLKELDIKDSTVITMVANFRKQKDYPTILSAIKLLEDYYDIIFLSCGSGTIFEDETKNIKKLAEKLNLKCVKFLGYRRDIPDILEITDIWVSSTLYEGQSNSLLEAMAMKKPIVTTNIEENAEVVRNEKEAILVPIKSPIIMGEAIKRLIENKDLAEKLASNAYLRVLKNYNITTTIKKLEKLYNSIV